MKICVLGWYGTETIGDRAILAGIISLLEKKSSNFEIFLGSLYPFYSKRMLVEDKSLYKILLDRDLAIEMFDSRCKGELEKNILAADIVIVGGGPLMDLSELHMLKHAFIYAKSKGKKTMIFGCGIGPLFVKEYQKVVLDIVTLSDVIVLRDSCSKMNLIELAKQHDILIDSNMINISFDPAVECAVKYGDFLDKTQIRRSREEIIINFREFPQEYSNNNISTKVEHSLSEFLLCIPKKYNDAPITLVPMHYFFIGNDDRVFMNRILFENKNVIDNVSVQNKPLSLVETMRKFYNAKVSVGMRFHSVVLQTLLNGNNYVLDYTEPKKGKITGFINDIDKECFYDKRYVNLQNKDDYSINEVLNFDNQVFEMKEQYYSDNALVYAKAIEKIL